MATVKKYEVISALVLVFLPLAIHSATLKASPELPALTLEEFLDGKLEPKKFIDYWSTNEEVIGRDEPGNILLKNVATGTNETLISINDIKELVTGKSFNLSPDRKFVLISQFDFRVSRRKHVRQYFIADLASKKSFKIEIDGGDNFFYFALWNPKTSGLLINYYGDLFYMKSPYDSPIQITNDQDPAILNGVGDWTYTENIFADSIASFFSRDGKKIVFLKLDVRNVGLARFPLYAETGNQYVGMHEYRYALPGTPIAIPDVFTVDLDKLDPQRGTELVHFAVPVELANVDRLVGYMLWANNDDVVIAWTDRKQITYFFQKCSTTSKECKVIAKVDGKLGPVTYTKNFGRFNGDGSQMVIIAPHLQSNDDYFGHLTVYSTEKEANEQKPIVLTQGLYVVLELHLWDAKTNRIFYLANLPNDLESQHLFTIKAQAGAEPQCLTCTMDGDDGKYYSLEFNNNGTILILSRLGPAVTRVNVYNWTEVGDSVQLHHIRNLVDNVEFEATIMKKRIPTVKIEQFELGNGFTAAARLLLPNPFDESKKYPMLVDIYGAPGASFVTHKFGLEWGGFLASNKSFIYAHIDARGSGLRGDRLMHATYGHVGPYEAEDNIIAVRKLTEKYPFIDASRVGVWGWSYGGLTTAHAIAQDNNGTNHAFKCGASSGAVFDFAKYEATYAERLLGLPSENPEGYYKARIDTEEMIEKFRNRTFLLIHGTSDDNTQLNQVLPFTKEMQRRNIPFEHVFYPDQHHLLSDVRPHLYGTLGRFFENCFA